MSERKIAFVVRLLELRRLLRSEVLLRLLREGSLLRLLRLSKLLLRLTELLLTEILSGAGNAAVNGT